MEIITRSKKDVYFLQFLGEEGNRIQKHNVSFYFSFSTNIAKVRSANQA